MPPPASSTPPAAIASQADGTVETISHDVTRLGSRKGIDSLGEYQGITFNPNHQKLILNEARIHKKNGGIVPIEPRHVQLRDVATDFQVYDPDKQLVISFPNLEVGDVYEVKWTVRGKNPEFGDQFFTRYTFGDDRYPTVRDEMHVVIPKDKPFKFGIVNGKLEQKIDGNRTHRHYQWAVTNRPPLPKEDDRPSMEELRLQIAVSTFASWEAVAQWKQQAAGGMLEVRAAGAQGDRRGGRAAADAAGQGAGPDLLGAPAGPLCVARAGRSRLHAASARAGAGQPLRRLQGPGPAPRRHAQGDRPAGLPRHAGHARRRPGAAGGAVALGNARHPAGEDRRQGPLD